MRTLSSFVHLGGSSQRRFPSLRVQKFFHNEPGYGRSNRFTQEHHRKVTPPKQRKEKSLYSLPFLEWYSKKLDTHPILTKAISSAIISGSGDVLSQCIEARNKKQQTFLWDPVRTSRFGVLGIALIGPVIHVWYGAVMRWFPGSSSYAVAKRVVVDQLVFSPIFLPTFLSGLWFLEGKPVDQILPALQRTVPEAIVANWVLWIPAQIINFRFVPGKYQVLFSNFIGLIWNAYLSYTTHSDGSSP